METVSSQAPETIKLLRLLFLSLSLSLSFFAPKDATFLLSNTLVVHNHLLDCYGQFADFSPTQSSSSSHFSLSLSLFLCKPCLPQTMMTIVIKVFHNFPLFFVVTSSSLSFQFHFK
jgi:hypothetical protein